MNINRNNYEECFLLYADNELSAQQKILVEIFVKKNIDLEEEFLMVQQSVVKPDEQVVLEDKSFLFKKEQESISADNQTEKLILYNDNELNEEERTSIKKSIREDYLLKKEFDLLQRVKLEPEASLVFPDKKLLYKKEDDRRVIPLKWWKSMAAALLAGLGLWTGITYIQKNKTETPVVVKADNTKVESLTKIDVPSITVLTQPDKISIANKKGKQSSSSLNQKTEKTFIVSSLKKKTTINRPQPNKIIEKPLEQTNQLNENNVVAVQKKNNDISNLSTNNLEPASDKIKASDQIITDSQPLNNAQTVSYVVEPQNDNHVFYNISTEKFNKSKIGGFLKKIKRTIERKSPFHQKDSDKTDVAVN